MTPRWPLFVLFAAAGMVLVFPPVAAAFDRHQLARPLGDRVRVPFHCIGHLVEELVQGDELHYERLVLPAAPDSPP